MALRRLAVHYDVISPYSWLGFEQIHRHHRMWQDDSIKLELKPTFIGGIMKASGNKPPGVVVNKMLYMMHDLNRLNTFLQVPIVPLSDPATTLFVKGSTKAMRVLTALDIEDPSKLEKASHELWMQIWHRDLDITDDGIITEALAKAGVTESESAKLIAMTAEPAIKKRLIEVTQEAIDAQAFGAPTFIVREEGKDDQMFFGQDRIELLCAELNKPYYGPALGGKIF